MNGGEIDYNNRHMVRWVRAPFWRSYTCLQKFCRQRKSIKKFGEHWASRLQWVEAAAGLRGGFRHVPAGQSIARSSYLTLHS